MSQTYHNRFRGNVPCINGIVQCENCKHENHVYTPKGQGTKDYVRLKDKPASKKHILILRTFDENPEQTMQDIVLNVKRLVFKETGMACSWDTASLAHERSDLVSWEILAHTSFRSGSPVYTMNNSVKAMALRAGGIF